MKNVFSANALATMLERDRATILRALRHTPPDATERKQPRWKMTTAIAAVDALPGSHNSPPKRRASYVTNDVGQTLFKAGICFARTNDALLALGDMPDDQDLRLKEFGRVLNLIADLESAFATEGKPSEHSEVRSMLGRMMSGLMFATGIRLTEDDGTPCVPEKDIRAYTPPVDDLKR